MTAPSASVGYVSINHSQISCHVGIKFAGEPCSRPEAALSRRRNRMKAQDCPKFGPLQGVKVVNLTMAIA
ncbi:MAG: hypothetical protein ACLR67_13030, partial [Eggerthella lenta]